jgi:PAS domain S-box-containing protein
VSPENKAVLFNAVPLFVLAAAYLAVAATLVPQLWRERARFTLTDAALALMFPCIGIPLAIFGGAIAHERRPIGGHLWISFAACVIALIPALLFLIRWRERRDVLTGGARAREAEQLVTVRGRELEAVSAISDALSRTDDPTAAGRVLLDEVGAVFGIEFTALALIDEDGKAAHGFLAREAGQDVGWWRDVRLDLDTEPSGIASAYHQAAPVVVFDCAASPLVSPRLVEAVGAKSGVFVPLILEQRVIGVLIGAPTAAKRAFAGEEVTLMQSLAAEAALAIERTRSAGALDAALAENARRLEEQTALLRAGQALTSELQLDAVLQTLVDEVAALLRCEAADCYLLDAQRNVLRCAAVHGLEPELVGFEFPTDRGLAGEAIASGSSALSRDYAELADAVPHPAYAGYAGAIVAPMVWSGEIRGVLGVGTRDSDRAFAESDADLLQAFAALAALALRNAESFEERSRQARIQQAFYDIASVLAAPISHAETLHAVARAAAQALGAQSAALLMPARGGLRLAAGYELAAPLAALLTSTPPEPLGHCASARTLLAASALEHDDRFAPEWRDAVRSSGHESLLAVPVEAPGGEGGLALVFFAQPHRFSDYDLELAQNLAGAARGALERSELFESERRARALAQQLARTGGLLTTELDPAAVLDEIVAQAPDLLGADAAVVRLLQGEELVVSAVRGDVPDDLLESRAPSTGWAGGDVVQMRAPVWMGDARDGGAGSSGDPLVATGYDAFLAVPLVGSEDGLEGVLTVYAREQRAWRQDEIEALSALAGNASAALASAELYQRVALEKERSVAILANIADGIVAVDREGSVVLWNAAAERITGVRAGDALGRTTAEVLQRALEAGDGAPAEGDRLVSIRRGGDEAWLSVTEAVMHDPAGAVAGRIFAFRDISTERVVEQMKSDFVTAVSHELRTPLTSIYGFAETLLRQDVLFGDEERQTFLRYIASESERLTGIVDQLLNVARLDTGDLQVNLAPTDVRAVVSDVVRSAEQAANANGHRFVLDLPEDPLDAEADADKLRQILANLVDNAVKFSPGGGTVTVGARLADERVEVRVVDEGIGIPEEERRRIFTRFYRGESVGRGPGTGGTGLGLFIAQGLVSAMGGRMWVDSDEGNGSSFTFELPAAQRAALAGE